MPRSALRAAAAVLLLPLAALAGCVSQEQEQQLGDMMAADINAQLPLVHDPLLRLYIERLGQSLVEVSERPELEYRFYIINADMVNAFALPGGHIYLTRGLIERTESGPELAGVLAHEIGHVAARHGVQKLERHLRTGSLVSLMYHLILGGEPELLRRNSLQLAGIVWNASHSREDEQEADRLAVRYLVRAGVDPRGIISLLETMLEEEEELNGQVAEWFSTHPMTETRIRETQQEIAKQLEGDSPELSVRLTSYPAFLRRIATLPPPSDASDPHH